MQVFHRQGFKPPVVNRLLEDVANGDDTAIDRARLDA